MVIKIPFTGNPKPTVKWVRDGVEIKGRNYIQEVTDRHAILTIKEATKEDDGPYRLTLENELGTDSAVIKIQINGERHFNTINLTWPFWHCSVFIINTYLMCFRLFFLLGRKI